MARFLHRLAATFGIIVALGAVTTYLFLGPLPSWWWIPGGIASGIILICLEGKAGRDG